MSQRKNEYAETVGELLDMLHCFDEECKLSNRIYVTKDGDIVSVY